MRDALMRDAIDLMEINERFSVGWTGQMRNRLALLALGNVVADDVHILSIDPSRTNERNFHRKRGRTSSYGDDNKYLIYITSVDVQSFPRHHLLLLISFLPFGSFVVSPPK